MGGDTSIDKAESQLVQASMICLVFMIAEVIGGYFAGSLAIMTDAAHLLSDLTGFMVSLICLWLTKRKATAVLSFGFKRAEVLGALLSVSLIWVVTGFLLVEAVERTSLILKKDPSYEPVNGRLMFAIACLGLLCNLIMLKVLGHSHSHGPGGGHGHSHAPEPSSSHGHSHDDHGHSHDDHGHSHDDHGHSHDDHGHSHEDHGHSHENGDHGHSHSHDEEDDVEKHGHSHAHVADNDHGHSHGGDSSDDEKHGLLPSRSPTPPPLKDDYEMNGLSIRYSIVSNDQDYGTIESPTLAAQEERHRQNLNVEAAYIHALGDFIQSVGVIIAGALIWMFPFDTHPKMQLADPLATFLFSILVLYSTFQVLKTSVNVLMEGVPAGLDPIKIKAAIERLPGVAECHDLHVWSLSIGHPFLSVHVVLEKGASSDDVLRSVHQLLYVRYRISHSTVQVEPEHHYSDGKLKKNTECHEYNGDEL